MSNLKVIATSPGLISSPEDNDEQFFFDGFGDPIPSSFEAVGSEGEASTLPLLSWLKKKSTRVRSRSLKGMFQCAGWRWQ